MWRPDLVYIMGQTDGQSNEAILRLDKNWG